MIIVHQMAKVASMAWVEAARPAAQRMGTVPLHTHFLTAGNLEALAAILAAPPDVNTIVNPLIVRSMLRHGTRAARDIAATQTAGRPVHLITGMRDPVARSVSLLSFFADFCGHKSRSLSGRDGASAAAVSTVLGDLWRAILGGAPPRGSFERLMWHMIGAYRTWFDDEVRSAFDVDIFAAPFPNGPGSQRFDAPGLRILVYRAEDLPVNSPAHPLLLEAARTFLGVPAVELAEINTAATRRSYPLYVQLRQQFRLPAALLDDIYDAPVVRHFYSAAEIAAFKTKWTAPMGVQA